MTTVCILLLLFSLVRGNNEETSSSFPWAVVGCSCYVGLVSLRAGFMLILAVEYEFGLGGAVFILSGWVARVDTRESSDVLVAVL